MQQTRGPTDRERKLPSQKKKEFLRGQFAKNACSVPRSKLVRHGDPKSMHRPATGWN